MCFFKLLSYFLLRMSLAMYAAPFDTDINQINNKDNDNPINKKRNINNRTQRRVPKENIYSDKVNSVLQSIHNLPDQSDGLSDFNPLPPPASMGVEQTRIRENMESSAPESNGEGGERGGHMMSNGGHMMSNGGHMMSNDPTMMQHQQQESGENMSREQEKHYKRFMPNYDAMYKKSPNNLPYYLNTSVNQRTESNTANTQDILTQKLNYMINLLEERQDERTNNVTEEVVLYSFLGIFIIFIVDSFARVGKYTR